MNISHFYFFFNVLFLHLRMVVSKVLFIFFVWKMDKSKYFDDQGKSQLGMRVMMYGNET